MRLTIRYIIVRNAPLILFVFSLSACSPSRSQHVLVQVPKTAEIYDTSGHRLGLSNDYEGRTVIVLSYPENDMLFVKWESKFYELKPESDLGTASAFAIIATMGIGAFIENVGHAEREYVSVRFTPADTSKLPIAISPHAENLKDTHVWNVIGRANYGGLSFQSYVAPFSWPRGEIGLGLGVKSCFETYLNYESIDLMHLKNTKTGSDFTGRATGLSVQARVFLYDGLFMSGGYQRVHATSSIDHDSLSSGVSSRSDPFAGSSDFNSLLVSVGYSLSWAYVELQDAFSAKTVLFGSQMLNYSFLVLKFGVNLRLPNLRVQDI
jgi:hypothetical protein